MTALPPPVRRLSLSCCPGKRLLRRVPCRIRGNFESGVTSSPLTTVAMKSRDGNVRHACCAEPKSNHNNNNRQPQGGAIHTGRGRILSAHLCSHRRAPRQQRAKRPNAKTENCSGSVVTISPLNNGWWPPLYVRNTQDSRRGQGDRYSRKFKTTSPAIYVGNRNWPGGYLQTSLSCPGRCCPCYRPAWSPSSLRKRVSHLSPMVEKGTNTSDMLSGNVRDRGRRCAGPSLRKNTRNNSPMPMGTTSKLAHLP